MSDPDSTTRRPHRRGRAAPSPPAAVHHRRGHLRRFRSADLSRHRRACTITRLTEENFSIETALSGSMLEANPAHYLEILRIDRLGDVSFMPASRQACRSSSKALAVMARMGVVGAFSPGRGWPGGIDAVHYRHLHVHQDQGVAVLPASASACWPSSARSTTSPASSSSRARLPA
jgi:hypothetical protein